MPLVNFDAMRQAYFRDAGAKYDDVIYRSKPADWKWQVITPNNSTEYVMFFVNLKDGPVVVDVPPVKEAALFGSLIDSWNIPLIDVGGAGKTKGKAQVSSAATREETAGSSRIHPGRDHHIQHIQPNAFHPEVFERYRHGERDNLSEDIEDLSLIGGGIPYGITLLSTALGE
jgi:hypothetical protein